MVASFQNVNVTFPRGVSVCKKVKKVKGKEGSVYIRAKWLINEAY